MSKNYDYFYTKLATGTLDVEDSGNCYIEAFNDEGHAYYLLIETSLGYTKIFEYGPAISDFQELPSQVVCTFDRIEFNQKEIDKRINNFLNNFKRNITQATEVERSVIFENCKSLIDYVEKRENF